MKFSFKINSKLTLTIGHDHICATTFALYIYDNGRLLRGGAMYKQPVVTDILTASSVLVILDDESSSTGQSIFKHVTSGNRNNPKNSLNNIY